MYMSSSVDVSILYTFSFLFFFKSALKTNATYVNKAQKSNSNYFDQYLKFSPKEINLLSCGILSLIHSVFNIIYSWCHIKKLHKNES